jgi:hypothetical protein
VIFFFPEPIGASNCCQSKLGINVAAFQTGSEVFASVYRTSLRVKSEVRMHQEENDREFSLDAGAMRELVLTDAEPELS